MGILTTGGVEKLRRSEHGRNINEQLRSLDIRLMQLPLSHRFASHPAEVRLRKTGQFWLCCLAYFFH